jgi:hypothetical protein
MSATNYTEYGFLFNSGTIQWAWQHLGDGLWKPIIEDPDQRTLTLSTEDMIDTLFKAIDSQDTEAQLVCRNVTASEPQTIKRP